METEANNEENTMKFKHTPGPWYAQDYCADNGKPNPRRFIASEAVRPCHTVADVEGGSFTDEENNANAQLIASAPDMLAALKSVIDLANEEPLSIPPQIEAACRAAVDRATAGSL